MILAISDHVVYSSVDVKIIGLVYLFCFYCRVFKLLSAWGLFLDCT